MSRQEQDDRVARQAREQIAYNRLKEAEREAAAGVLDAPCCGDHGGLSYCDECGWSEMDDYDPDAL